MHMFFTVTVQSATPVQQYFYNFHCQLSILVGLNRRTLLLSLFCLSVTLVIHT